MESKSERNLATDIELLTLSYLPLPETLDVLDYSPALQIKYLQTYFATPAALEYVSSILNRVDLTLALLEKGVTDLVIRHQEQIDTLTLALTLLKTPLKELFLIDTSTVSILKFLTSLQSNANINKLELHNFLYTDTNIILINELLIQNTYLKSLVLLNPAEYMYSRPPSLELDFKQILTNDHNLTELNLSSFDYGDTTSLAEGLKNNTKLTKLILYDANITHKFAQVLEDTSLTYLDLNNSKNIRTTAYPISANTSLTYLNLSHTSINSSSVATILKYNYTLKELILSACSLEEIYLIAEKLAMNRSLTLIDLSLNMYEENDILALADMLKVNKVLKTLNLGLVNLFESKAPEYFVAALSQNLSLTHLETTWTKLAPTIWDVLSQNQHLQKLYLPLSEFGTILGLNLSINTGLRELNLRKTNLKDSDLKIIADGLLENKTLEILRLAKNKFDGIGILKLAESLLVNKTLKFLDLESSVPDYPDPELIPALIILATKTNLETLFIGSIFIYTTDYNEDIFFQELINTNLKKLSISHDGIRKYILRIAELIRTNTTLTWLNLSDNNLSKDNITPIIEALKENKTLTEIDLRRNIYGIDDLLKDVLLSNPILKNILV